VAQVGHHSKSVAQLRAPVFSINILLRSWFGALTWAAPVSSGQVPRLPKPQTWGTEDEEEFLPARVTLSRKLGPPVPVWLPMGL